MEIDLIAELNKISASGAAKPKPKKRPALTPCDGCRGDGIYYGRGYVENGVFKGVTGTCFRCGGKGKQDEADRRRNYGYDNFYRRISA